MAKSKPIGVRFDEDVVKIIQEKYPQFETHQSILNFLMDIYPAYENMKALTRHELITNIKRSPNLAFKPENGTCTTENKKAPPEGLKGIDLAIWKSENWK